MQVNPSLAGFHTGDTNSQFEGRRNISQTAEIQTANLKTVVVQAVVIQPVNAQTVDSKSWNSPGCTFSAVDSQSVTFQTA